MSDRDDSKRPSAATAPPATDQPPSLAAAGGGAETASSNSTSIVSRETATTPTTDGYWPSVRFSARAVVLPSSTPVRSTMADALIVIEPVASADAFATVNWISCVLPPLPATGPAIARAWPSMSGGPYADGWAVTLLLYWMVMVPGPVMRAELISGTWPYGMSRTCGAWPKGLGGGAARSNTAASFSVRLPVALSGTAVPLNAIVCESVLLPASPSLLRAVPLTVMSEYADRGAVAGSLYVMVRALPAVMLAETTSGGRPSPRACRSRSGPASALPASSATSAVTITAVPVALVASTRSPPNAIVCVRDPFPDRIMDGRGSASPLGTSTFSYAVFGAETFSLYRITASPPPVMRAESITGGIPSATGTGPKAASALPAASATTMPPPLAYDTATPSGRVSARSASSARSSAAGSDGGIDRPDTARPAGASVPDTDQPPALLPDAEPATGSSNATRIVRSDVAAAPVTEGACPSRTVWFTPSITIQPVEFGCTVAGLSNRTSTSPPDAGCGIAIRSMLSMDSPWKRCGATPWSSYRTVTTPGPVTLADVTTTGRPSVVASASGMSPRGLRGGSARSRTRRPSIVTLPAPVPGWTAVPLNSTLCRAVPLPPRDMAARAVLLIPTVYAASGAVTGSV